MTIDGKGGTRGKVGERTPALWIFKGSQLYISQSLNGKPAEVKLLETGMPLLNVWNVMEISQLKKEGKHLFSLVVNGETLWSVENKKPTELFDVKVFGSSNWYTAQEGSIRRFQIENRVPGETLENSLCISKIQISKPFNLSL